MAKGWHRESRRHSLASRGIKTSTSKTNAMKKVDIDPFDYQNNNQEKLIHSSKWENGTSYRYILEGSGDVFRELTQKTPHNDYLDEKLSRIERHLLDNFNSPDWNLDDVKQFDKTYGLDPRKTRIHPEDSFEWANKNNKKTFEQLEKKWSNQPYNTFEQKLAIDLNLALLKKDFFGARIIIGKIRNSM